MRLFGYNLENDTHRRFFVKAYCSCHNVILCNTAINLVICTTQSELPGMYFTKDP